MRISSSRRTTLVTLASLFVPHAALSAESDFTCLSKAFAAMVGHYKVTGQSAGSEGELVDFEQDLFVKSPDPNSLIFFDRDRPINKWSHNGQAYKLSNYDETANEIAGEISVDFECAIAQDSSFGLNERWEVKKPEGGGLWEFNKQSVVLSDTIDARLFMKDAGSSDRAILVHYFTAERIPQD